MTDAAARYRETLAEARARLGDLDRSFSRVGWIRLAVFIAGAGTAVSAVLSRGGLAAWGTVGLAIGFAILIVWHERISRRRDRAARSVRYYERGLARLEHRWLEGGDPGDRFKDDRHLYATDLELFGKGSLFHYLSTAGTETGSATLASWLLAPASAGTIRERQQAVAELAPNLTLRHDLAVAASDAHRALDSGALRAWLAGPGPTLPPWLAPLATALAAINVVATLAALKGIIPGWPVAVAYLVSIVVALAFRHAVVPILVSVSRPVRELSVIASLLDRVGREPFASPLLRSLSSTWSDPARPAAHEIARLRRFVDLIDARRNQFFAPVAALLLSGTQLAAAVERWRIRTAATAAGWLDAIGQLEALASLGTLAFEHPDDAMPEVAEGPAGLVARAMAHPLLPMDRAVRNDVALGDPVRLLVVSGSNMSGKSTLLKAIGTNLVLAYAGGPVRAGSLTIGQWTLGASLVLRDSLLEGRSRFYAEVLRLRDIVAETRGGRPVLFLLDELLSGTNSHDRAIGARGILMGLIGHGAIGVITTHDLALTDIATAAGPRGANWHLEDTLVNGTLEFDYRLKPGVVERSNALELMKAVGLEVEPS